MASPTAVRQIFESWLWQRLLGRCGSGSVAAAPGTRCLSLGDYVTGRGARGGPPLPEGVDVDYPPALRRTRPG